MTTDCHADKDAIVVFPSTHVALRAEKLARADGISVRMAPVPRDVSADCNMGMRVAREDVARLQALFDDEGVVCEIVVRSSE